MREQQSDQAGTAGQQASYVGESSAPGRVSRPPVEEVWASASDPERGCEAIYGTKEGKPNWCRVISVACDAKGVMYGDGSRAVVGHRVKTSTGQRADDWRKLSCVQPGTGSSGGVEAAPVVVTETEFASLGVEPLVAHLGPPVAMQIPTSMDVIVWAERRVQELHTELLGQDVVIRATPIKYVWTFGDGTELTTSFAGRPWPERDISMRYRNEGWYELSLTTEFAGEYSVAGGPFVPIDGTIHVTSEPRWLYANVMKARLVSGPVDPALNEIPERTEETLGKPNPKAKKTTLKYPGQNTKKKRR
ncbi:MAG: hypothetical protein Q4G21_01560 [Dermabacter sp.]|nr:hypothetical protein [Dermabacter sp.]